MTSVNANAPAQQGYGKSMAAVAAGALSTIVVLTLDQYVLPTPMSAELSDAIQTFVTAAAVFLTPHNFGGGQ